MNAQALVDQLNAFADAESIKEYFKLIGVKGYRQDENACPISRFIGNATGCSVSTEDTIKVYTGEYDGPYDPIYSEFETSAAVKDFIDQFDSGTWPELDADWYEDEDHGNPWL